MPHTPTAAFAHRPILGAVLTLAAACGGRSGGASDSAAAGAAPSGPGAASAQNAAAAGIPAPGAAAVERADSATDSVVMQSVAPTREDSSLATGSRDSAAGVNRSGMPVSRERATSESNKPANQPARGGAAKP